MEADAKTAAVEKAQAGPAELEASRVTPSSKRNLCSVSEHGHVRSLSAPEKTPRKQDKSRVTSVS